MAIKDLVLMCLNNISRTKPFFIANIIAVSVGVLMVVVMLSLAQGVLKYSGNVMKEEASANAIEVTSVPTKPDAPRLTADQISKIRSLSGVTQVAPLVQGLFGDLSASGHAPVVVSLSSSTGTDDPEMQRLTWVAGSADHLSKKMPPKVQEDPTQGIAQETQAASVRTKKGASKEGIKIAGNGVGIPSVEKSKMVPKPEQRLHSIIIPETLLSDLKTYSASEALGAKLTLTFSRSDGKNREKKAIDVEVAGVARKTRFSRCYLPLELMDELFLWQNGLDKDASVKSINYENVMVYAKGMEEVPAIRKELEKEGYRTSSVLDTVSKLKEISLIIYVFLGTLGGISLFTGSISIFNATYASVLRRVKEFAIFRSYGASRITILSIVLFESVITATVAGILGFVGGDIVTKVICHQWLANMDTNLFVVPHYFLPLAIILAVVVCGFAASGPAWKAANMPPAEAIRNS